MISLVYPVAKAIAPLVVGAIVAILGSLGITETMTVSEAVFFAVTSAVVYLVPNKKVK